MTSRDDLRRRDEVSPARTRLGLLGAPMVMAFALASASCLGPRRPAMRAATAGVTAPTATTTMTAPPPESPVTPTTASVDSATTIAPASIATTSTTVGAFDVAALDPTTCIAKLHTHGIPFVDVGAAVPGVEQPIRLTGPIGGIDFHGTEAPKQRMTTVYEIIDCRFALSLEALAGILAQHDIVEVMHLSVYRPPTAKDGKAHSQHEEGLAIDLASMTKRDGTKLVVLGDWHGGIGQKTCGPGAAPSSPTKNALEIRAILCAIADSQIFNVVLTPNFNEPHKNHFHLDIKRGVHWHIVH